MTRLLVRITKAKLRSYEHLVGNLAIAYPTGPSVLRLAQNDPLLGNRRYIAAKDVETTTIRETSYDDYSA